jgi:3-deoxy-D-manno-octulosonic-acid transferase
MRFLHQVFYNVAFFAAFMLTWPYFTWRLWRRGKLWSREFWQRLGLYPRHVKDKIGSGVDLWIHAVSVGEAMIAEVLIQEMRRREPKLRIVLSTTTPTGQRVARRCEDERTTVIYNPTDFLWSVRQAFELIRPKRLILIEAEVWPNYIWCAKRRNIPVYLVNARLSPRSGARYWQFRFFCRPVLEQIDLVLAQNETEVPRLVRAGFPPEAIFTLGSMKYDVANHEPINGKAELRDMLIRCDWKGDNPILLAGSTHPGEEEIMARIFSTLRKEFPKLRLIIAPRHAERAGSIKQLCDLFGFTTRLRSKLSDPMTDKVSPEILILDTTGELRSLYAMASIVFVGKSLRGRGGQNFIEAARVGAPTLVGPNMQNFATITADFLRNDGLWQVSNEFELEQKIRELLLSPEKRGQLGQRGRETFERNLGAGRRTAEIVVKSFAGRN